MKKITKLTVILAALLITVGFMASPLKAYAAATGETAVEAAQDPTSAKAWSAAIAIGAAAAAGALAMGLVIAKTVDGIARQPEAEGKIRTAMMLGLVFVETVVIYALIVAILIVFVL